MVYSHYLRPRSRDFVGLCQSAIARLHEYHFVKEDVMESRLEDVEFEGNAEPRCPVVLLLDTSGSMAGSRFPMYHLEAILLR